MSSAGSGPGRAPASAASAAPAPKELRWYWTLNGVHAAHRNDLRQGRDARSGQGPACRELAQAAGMGRVAGVRGNACYLAFPRPRGHPLIPIHGHTERGLRAQKGLQPPAPTTLTSTTGVAVVACATA